MKIKIAFKIALALVLLLSISACRLFQPEKYAKRDACMERLPILDEKPVRPYRVVRTINGRSDEKLRERACAVEADAIIRAGVGMAFSAWSGSSGSLMQGLAIQWAESVPQPVIPEE